MKRIGACIAAILTLPVFAASLRLTWDDPNPATAGVTNYIVHALYPGQSNLLHINTGTNREFFIADAGPGSYSFTVMAQTPLAVSAPSTTAVAMVTAGLLSPTNIQISITYTIDVHP